MSGLIQGALENGAIPYGECQKHWAVATKHSTKSGKLGHLTPDGWCVSKWKYEVIGDYVWGYEPQEESK